MNFSSIHLLIPLLSSAKELRAWICAAWSKRISLKSNKIESGKQKANARGGRWKQKDYSEMKITPTNAQTHTYVHSTDITDSKSKFTSRFSFSFVGVFVNKIYKIYKIFISTRSEKGRRGEGKKRASQPAICFKYNIIKKLISTRSRRWEKSYK